MTTDEKHRNEGAKPSAEAARNPESGADPQRLQPDQPGKTLPMQGDATFEGEPNMGRPVPKQPNDRDESSGSQGPNREPDRKLMEQAGEDLRKGRTDTDIGPPLEELSRRNPAPGGGEASGTPRSENPGAGALPARSERPGPRSGGT